MFEKPLIFERYHQIVFFLCGPHSDLAILAWEGRNLFYWQGSVEKWIRCNHHLSYTNSIRDCVSYHANLSKKGYRSLIYRSSNFTHFHNYKWDLFILLFFWVLFFSFSWNSGDHDFIVPFLATQAWIRSLNYSIVDDWRQWIVEGQVAGLVLKYKPLTLTLLRRIV